MEDCTANHRDSRVVARELQPVGGSRSPASGQVLMFPQITEDNPVPSGEGLLALQ